MNFDHRLRGLAALSFSVALVACGGGGGGDPAPAPAPAATPLTVSGVAATGAALAGASVTLKCQRGTASGTTSATGAFTLTSADAALPCVIRATLGATTLHSLVEAGQASPATAHVTPLTELLLAQVAGAPATSLFDTFDAAAQARLTAAAVATASAQVKTALARIADLSQDDLLRGALVPSVNGSTGNLLDAKLEALARALGETGATLNALAAALVATPGAVPPVFTALPQAAATCPALRSGAYAGFESENPEFSNEPFTIDAVALTATYGDENLTVNLQPVADQPCRFTIKNDTGIDGDDEWAVSSAGVIVSHFREGGLLKPAVFAPVRPLTRAEFAGNWNYVGHVGPLVGGRPVHGSFTLDVEGVVSDATYFLGSTPIPAVLARDALKGVKAPNGDVFLMGNPTVGGQGMVFAAKAQTLTVPSVGHVTAFWEFLLSQGVAQAVNPQTATVETVAAATFTRRRPASGLNAERIETLAVNTPRAGLRSRTTAGCTDAAGVAVACAGFVQLPMASLGVTANAGISENSFFSIAVIRP